MNSRFPISLSIQWHHMERKVVKRQEDEDKIVNFIGRRLVILHQKRCYPHILTIKQTI